MNYTIQIRPKRQATFPEPLLQAMGVGVGDSFEAKINNNKEIVLKSKKQISLNALKELQKAFRESGITEKELQRDLEKQRADSVKPND